MRDASDRRARHTAGPVSRDRSSTYADACWSEATRSARSSSRSRSRLRSSSPTPRQLARLRMADRTAQIQASENPPTEAVIIHRTLAAANVQRATVGLASANAAAMNMTNAPSMPSAPADVVALGSDFSLRLSEIDDVA